MDAKEIRYLQAMGDPTPVGEMDTYAKILLYGTHGVSKTTTACTVVKPGGKVLLHPIDDDWKSLKNHPEILKHTDVHTFKSCRQVKIIAKALREQIPPYDQYDTFVFDPVSSWVDKFLKGSTKGISFGEKPRPTPIDDTPEGKQLISGFDLRATILNDYNFAKIELQLIIDDLIAAPVNVIFTAHERPPSDKDKGSSADKVRPDMPEGCFTVVARACDAMGRVSVRRDGGRQISFKPASNEEAKSRLGTFRDQIISVERLNDHVNKFRFERKEETDG